MSDGLALLKLALQVEPGRPRREAQSTQNENEILSKWLVGGLSFHGVSGLCLSSLEHRLPGGIQAQGMRRRPMQAWVSCSGGTVCDPHALVGAPCGEQRGPDLEHSETTTTSC